MHLLFIHPADAWKVGWSYTPNIIHRKHCPSWYYSLKILFVAALALKVLTIFTLFLLFVLALFIIRSNVSFFFFFKLITMKVR